MNATVKTQPCTAEEVSSDWIDERRTIIRREGCAVRGNLSRPLIEVQAINTGHFHPLTLPTGGTLFVTFGDRDQILNRLNGLHHAHA